MRCILRWFSNDFEGVPMFSGHLLFLHHLVQFTHFIFFFFFLWKCFVKIFICRQFILVYKAKFKHLSWNQNHEKHFSLDISQTCEHWKKPQLSPNSSSSLCTGSYHSDYEDEEEDQQCPASDGAGGDPKEHVSTPEKDDQRADWVADRTKVHQTGRDGH